jgi:hypothetical protein
MTTRRWSIPTALLASALSCRAPDVAPVPSATISRVSIDPATATASDSDDDLGPRLRSIEEAEAFLLAANCFQTANISMGGWPPPSVRAFNTILDSPHAEESIERLLASPKPAARLYGACGLYYVARERHLSELEKLAALEGDLLLVNGCVIEELSISDVVERLRTTKIIEHLRL